MAAKRRKGGITATEYTAFDAAYAYYNAELFGGALPLCLITLQRKSRTKGFFGAGRFANRVTGDATDEVALNPDAFKGRSDKAILSTLVHEMAHLWQQHHGKPSRGRYHNAEWAAKMDALGLAPSSTEEPGGRRTGQRVSHYIISGGPFDVATDKLLASEFRLNWQSPTEPKESKPKDKSKTKYTCPGCGANVWAKPDTFIICGDCTKMAAAAVDEEAGTVVVGCDKCEKVVGEMWLFVPTK